MLNELTASGRQGKSALALFQGPPGTGKTLAASLIGKELNLEVYRIDLSGVISKYIGETEKNLKSLFATAEEKHWILLFDEADGLFGKRTNIKDSNDRYANIEISYLLQKIENYNGIVIFATNKRTDIDEGFLRRLRYVIDFPIPAPADRFILWQNELGKKQLAVDPKELSGIAEKFQLSGGTINRLVNELPGKPSESVIQQKLQQMKTNK